MSQTMQDLLVKYLIEPIPDSEDSSEALFISLLDTFHQLIRIRLVGRSPKDKKVSPYQDSPVINATKCIAILCKL